MDMRQIKKTVVLPVILLLLLTGCAKAAGEIGPGADTDAAGTGARGKYIETELNVPEGITDIYAIRLLDDSSLRLLSGNGVFDSEDHGQTWTRNENIPVQEYQEVSGGDISSSGEMLLITGSSEIACIAVGGGLADDLHIELPQTEGEDFTNMLLTVKFTSGDEIAALDLANNILLLDKESGRIRKQIDGGGAYREAVDCAGDMLLVQTSEGPEVYDREGNQQSRNELISAMMPPEEHITVAGEGLSAVVAQEDGKGFFAANKNGIAHYNFGGSVYETLVGSGGSLSNPEYLIRAIEVTDDMSFLVAFRSRTDQSLILKHYTYAADVQLRPADQLKVYSLYDNQTVRQGISVFNSKYPDIYVEYEIGISEDMGVTESDAVRTLNTDILGGNGPDIIILDGMPAERLAEKGLLLDISDTVEDAAVEEELFRSVTDRYEKDGEIHAIATRFTVPLLLGQTADMENINDLQGLVAAVRELKDQGPDAAAVLGLYDERLLDVLYDISAAAWIKSDGTPDQELIERFLSDVKTIQDTQTEGAAAGTAASLAADLNESEMPDLEAILNTRSGLQKLAIIRLGTLNIFNIMPSVMAEAGLGYRLASGQSANTFLPEIVIGISAKSSSPENARLFLREFMSTDIQTIDLGQGFPVNQKAFEMLTERQLTADRGEVAGMEETAADEREQLAEEINNLRGLIDSLEQEALTDRVVKNIVMAEGLKYLKDETGLEAAVSAIMQKTAIYLAE